jgi:two-component system chemotaxis response regulator CheY
MADQDMTVQTMQTTVISLKVFLLLMILRSCETCWPNSLRITVSMWWAWAEDGVQAIELFEQLNPDIMTLDIIMPKMRGTEVLETIMARYPEAKVVMASSVSDARTVMKCLKIGAKQYILKPYDEQKVMTAIKKALEM